MGAASVTGLASAFLKVQGAPGARKMDKLDFYTGLREFGVPLQRREGEMLLDYLDTEQDGTVNLDQFLQEIRGSPNGSRQAVIDKDFAKFDIDGSDFVSSHELRLVFNCSLHPKVQSGEMCADEVFSQFLQNFGDRYGDGSISRAQWNDYYAALSSSIAKDEHFIQLVNDCWALK